MNQDQKALLLQFGTFEEFKAKVEKAKANGKLTVREANRLIRGYNAKWEEKTARLAGKGK